MLKKVDEQIIPFHEYLKVKREQLGLKKADIARYHNLNSGYVSDLENGKRSLTPACFDRVVKAYQLTDEDLDQYELGQFNKKVGTPKKSNVKKIIESVNRFEKTVNETMTGNSPFEQGLKNRALNACEQTRIIFKQLKVIDEALENL
jgi:transcriptional regulator with XRE-family HTH domain